jgi:hypothetical protein
MTDEHAKTPVVTNPELDRAHRDLIALGQRLEEGVDTATSPTAIAVIADQVLEVNARVTAMGRVLLADRTSEITRHALAVSAAIRAVQHAIEDIESEQALVAGVAGLLATVDRAIEVVTMVCR